LDFQIDLIKLMCYFYNEGGKMNKKRVMCDFINEVNNRNLMTLFIKNIFGYEDFFDYNYLFRMINTDREIIIDIYDNISDNRFNRYIFSFVKLGYDIKVVEERNVFVSYISVFDVADIDNNLLKLAYLFKIDDNLMIEYANNFLDDVFVEILNEIVKKNYIMI